MFIERREKHLKTAEKPVFLPKTTIILRKI